MNYSAPLRTWIVKIFQSLPIAPICQGNTSQAIGAIYNLRSARLRKFLGWKRETEACKPDPACIPLPAFNRL